MTEEIKQIKQTLETWQHIIDFGYGTIEVPNETKIFKTILNLINKQQKEIEDLKDKIKDIIKCLEHEPYTAFDAYGELLYDTEIDIKQKLNKLLEEGEPNAK